MKYSKLRTELLERLQIAFDKINPIYHDPSPETSKTSQRKRKERSGGNVCPQKKVLDDSSFTLASASNSPTVTVN